LNVSSRRRLTLLAVAAVAVLAVTYAVVSQYASVATETTTSGRATCRYCITGPVSGEGTTVINGVEYYVTPVTSATDLRTGVVFHGVRFIQLPVTTTGCRGDWFLILFPDGTSEVIQIYYSCTGTPVKVPAALSKHECPRAGVMYKDGGLYLLVSKGCVSTAESAVSKKVEDWVIRLVAPSNISLSSPKLLYELIYVGEGFSAASTWLPPTPCKVLVRAPSGSGVAVLDRGICPWIRVNSTYIQPGYTYRHWIDLSNIAKEPGKYSITVYVSCTLGKINYRINTIENILVNTILSIIVDIK